MNSFLYFIYHLPSCVIYLLCNNRKFNFAKIREIRYVIYNSIATISTHLVVNDDKLLFSKEKMGVIDTVYNIGDKV